ncbi:MAG TPA: phosphatidate cytidylyltransferase [Candidatus Angelobacter sp.]|nr:phosphatidate cytidylyltransferase [Candidatus Angelobacter sp.]
METRFGTKPPTYGPPAILLPVKRLLTALILIPLVLAAVFVAPLWLFSLVIAALVLLTLHEYLKIAEGYGSQPFRIAAYGAAALVIAAFFASAGISRAASYDVWRIFRDPLQCLVLLPVIFGVPVIFRASLFQASLRSALSDSAFSAFGILYIAVPLGLLIPLRADPFQDVLIIFVLFAVWAGDIAAYYAGRAFGRRKLAPTVSPGKTWEGAIASLLASFVTAVLVFQFHRQIAQLFTGSKAAYFLVPGSLYRASHPSVEVSWGHVILLAVATNLAAQFGDLFESAMKRGAQVKDSGSILPGHGGLLDRIDALLFAVPVVWYYATLTEILKPF